MKVYIVIGKGVFSDEEIEAVFFNKENAIKYKEQKRCYRVEGYIMMDEMEE